MFGKKVRKKDSADWILNDTNKINVASHPNVVILFLKRLMFTLGFYFGLLPFSGDISEEIDNKKLKAQPPLGWSLRVYNSITGVRFLSGCRWRKQRWVNGVYFNSEQNWQVKFIIDLSRFSAVGFELWSNILLLIF